MGRGSPLYRIPALACCALLIAGCAEFSDLADSTLTESDANAKNAVRALGEAVTADDLTDVGFSDDLLTASDDLAGVTDEEIDSSAVPFEEIEWDEGIVFDDTTLRDDDGIIRARGGLAGIFINDIPDSDGP